MSCHQDAIIEQSRSRIPALPICLREAFAPWLRLEGNRRGPQDGRLCGTRRILARTETRQT